MKPVDDFDQMKEQARLREIDCSNLELEVLKCKDLARELLSALKEQTDYEIVNVDLLKRAEDILKP